MHVLNSVCGLLQAANLASSTVLSALTPGLRRNFQRALATWLPGHLVTEVVYRSSREGFTNWMYAFLRDGNAAELSPGQQQLLLVRTTEGHVFGQYSTPADPDSFMFSACGPLGSCEQFPLKSVFPRPAVPPASDIRFGRLWEPRPFPKWDEGYSVGDFCTVSQGLGSAYKSRYVALANYGKFFPEEVEIFVVEAP